MKKKFYILALAIITGSVFSLAFADNPQKSEADVLLGEIVTDIPKSLKSKPEVVSYILEMNELIDDYVMIYYVVLKSENEFSGKDVNNLNEKDKHQWTKMNSELYDRITQMGSKWGSYEDKLNFRGENFTETEKLGLEFVLKRYEQRLNQINEIFPKLFNQ